MGPHIGSRQPLDFRQAAKHVTEGPLHRAQTVKNEQWCIPNVFPDSGHLGMGKNASCVSFPLFWAVGAAEMDNFGPQTGQNCLLAKTIRDTLGLGC